MSDSKSTKQEAHVEGIAAPPSHKAHAEGAHVDPPPATTSKSNLKHYFSAAQNMYVNINPGKRVLEEGNVARIGEKGAQFLPNGSGYGQLITDDPEVIEWMEKHIKDGNNDIFTQQEYNKRLMTPGQTIESLERKVTEQNALIAKLQAEGKLGKTE